MKHHIFLMYPNIKKIRTDNKVLCKILTLLGVSHGLATHGDVIKTLSPD